MAALCFPLFVLLFNGRNEIIYLGVAIFLLILFRHKENIKRLLKGKERKLGRKSV